MRWMRAPILPDGAAGAGAAALASPIPDCGSTRGSVAGSSEDCVRGLPVSSGGSCSPDGFASAFAGALGSMTIPRFLRGSRTASGCRQGTGDGALFCICHRRYSRATPGTVPTTVASRCRRRRPARRRSPTPTSATTVAPLVERSLWCYGQNGAPAAWLARTRGHADTRTRGRGTPGPRPHVA
jgi:hypothetical protein